LIHYLDTSLLVAVFAAELGHERLADWMYVRAAQRLAISRWTRTEYCSALSVKIRTGQIETAARDRAWERFDAAATETFAELPIIANDFGVAADWCRNERANLRAGDALHLAIASRNDATLCTLDRKLSQAGERLGVKTLLV
jgi:predicted nucleic acid-binding protein